ncbi:hypothetical protein, variant [Verruconis gallopava]|uniref:3-phytase n=1 Tax=Verruconis gallopava TaxID=253628 RepID=A0A0D2AF07_9PEZI|nr:hypothetical protein, variant [Verruconis gallopava]KIW05015.1 hypothetical protein, variant [Verruconis gallopava]
MTSLEPRNPYTEQELRKLYPSELQLQLVQVLLRHGERSPVSPRFQNTGLRAYWPYCSAARQMRSLILSNPDMSQWDELQWRRRLEVFGADDAPTVASGPTGEYDAICQPGELTDKGRETTLALGRRLRHLYVEQLGFMPRLISDGDMIYLRATPMPRALESVQQAFYGLYPASSRTADFPPVTILTRSPADETLYPNDSVCRRFAQLSRAFAQRTADRWNESEEMDYLNKLLSKWMPENSPRVAVDGKPRLSGIMDTVNATLAHGPTTRLPKEFYDKKARQIIDKISVEEWFSGYTESQEYRKLGIGSLMGDIVTRMVGSVERNGGDGIMEVGGKDGNLGKGRGGEKNIRFALSGCHDTTLAGVLHSLGAFGQEPWPPFTSHIAIELFRQKNAEGSAVSQLPGDEKTAKLEMKQGWWSRWFKTPRPESISRRTLDEMSSDERKKLEGYYVRLRYNDKVMQIPGCKEVGKHFEGEPSFCTLVSAIVSTFDLKLFYHNEHFSGLTWGPC